jgi:hypothetical protein
MIASSTNRKLKQNIASVLKHKPRIVITDNGKVTQINQFSVVDNNGVYVILDKQFNLKKTAVAYAIALVNNDHILASQLTRIDRQISKFTEDIYLYKHYVKKNPKKKYLLDRISDSICRVNCIKYELNQTLKSIKIA